MTKNIQRSLLVTWLIVWHVVIFVFISRQMESTVTLDSWQHGIAICEKGENRLHTVTNEEFSAVQTKNFFILVNEGHQGDPQFQNLYRRAQVVCK